jgi:hypothetical protein
MVFARGRMHLLVDLNRQDGVVSHQPEHDKRQEPESVLAHSLEKQRVKDFVENSHAKNSFIYNFDF